jgi:hypothetical protein
MRLNYRISCAFALFWNMAKTHLPPEIIHDITGFLERTSIFRMDADQQSPTPEGKGTYTVDVGGIPVDFNGVELAPPMGMMSTNYCRAIHSEYQPHKYALAWTTARSKDSDAGGHFYASAYGIRIQSAPNTLVVWKPSKEHGTSLQKMSPDARYPDFCQTGLSIATSNRIESAWNKYMDGELDGLSVSDLFDESSEEEYTSGDE